MPVFKIRLMVGVMVGVMGALILTSACAHQSPRPAQEFSADVTRSIDAQFSGIDRSTPGCALGIFEQNGRRYLASYGMADLGKNVAITPRSVFAVASVSKQFTAFAALLLVRRNRLSLDDGIRRVIPELPVPYEAITLRQLLTHTSGLPEYEKVYDDESAPEYDGASRAQQLQTIVTAGAPQPPGKAARYTNTNYVLVAIMVERASGLPLAKFTQSKIFTPLSMTQSAFVESAATVQPHRALPYDKLPDGSWQATPYPAHVGPTGLQTSVLDMEHWAQNFYSPKVGDPDLIEQMQAVGALTDGSPVQFALGLERKRLGDQVAVVHTGVTVGTRSGFARFPEKRTTVVLLCNRMDVNTERVIGIIASELFR